MTLNPTPRSAGTSPLRSRVRWMPLVALVAAAALLVTILPMRGEAATSPALGTAGSYSVMAGSIVTNTGPTSLSGNLGISPGIGVAPHHSGFPPGVVLGTIHDANAVALLAQSSNTAAFGTLDQGCDVTYAGVQNLTLVSPLVAGVYCADAFLLTGNLTLSGAGVWIFKASSTLTTSAGSSVTGGDPCSIWWRLGSSATIGSGTSFRGNILALTSISMNTGANINGRLLAQTGAVTLQSNTITGPTCVQPPTSTATPTVTTVPGSTNTPLPGSTTVPTNTSVPAATNTGVPQATNTAIPTNILGVVATATPIASSNPPEEDNSNQPPQAQLFPLPLVAPPVFIPNAQAPAVTAETGIVPGVGQPPQSEVIVAPPVGSSQPSRTGVQSPPAVGGGLPSQSPLLLPPSSGDGGLIQPETSIGVGWMAVIAATFVSVPLSLRLIARRISKN